LLGDPSLQIPADKEKNETAKLDSACVLPASAAVKDEKVTNVGKCGKLSVSA